jgi:hypothetical protein
MTRITQQNLESYLTGGAVLLRGTIDAGHYRQFNSTLMFDERDCFKANRQFQHPLRHRAEHGKDLPSRPGPGADWKSMASVFRESPEQLNTNPGCV